MKNSPLSITELANVYADPIYEWVRSQPVDEIRELATAFRIPNAPVANGANVAALDHFQERGSFMHNPRDGFQQPGHPYRMRPAQLREPGQAPRLGEHTAQYRAAGLTPRSVPVSRQPATQLPLRGLRVLDMTTFWAGPSCTHFLAMLGAEVIHLESTRRPDGTRLIAGIPVTEEQWWEKSPIFAALNTNKKGLTLDLQSARGRELLRKLIATCDVIAENFTPRVLDQIGLDFAAVQAIRPDAVMLRMPGFGLDGPWRDNPAFAYVIESAAGVSWLTGYPDRTPFEPYSVGDPNAGVHALNALLLALEHRRRTGQGVLVEAAMVDAALNIAAEQIIEYSAYGACWKGRVIAGRQRFRRTSTAPTKLTSSTGPTPGSPSRWPTTSSGTGCVVRSNHPPGQPIRIWPRYPVVARRKISLMSGWPRGVNTGRATRSSPPSGTPACRWPRSCSHTARGS